MNGKVPDQQLWHLLQTAGSFYKYTVFNPLFSKFGSFYFVCRRQLHFKPIRTKKKYLVEDEWALQATFAGSICQQVGLHLLQAGQQRATGTTWGETTTLERWHFSWGSSRAQILLIFYAAAGFCTSFNIFGLRLLKTGNILHVTKHV